MSRNSDYKNLKELTKSLAKGIEKLESGNLDSKELTSLLNDSRTLHERITVLQYLAFDKEVKEIKKPKKEIKKPQGNFELNFGTPEIIEEKNPIEGEGEDDIHPNQTNLLDAIEEHVDEVVDPESEVEIKVEAEPEKELQSKSINETFANETSEKTLADKLSRQPIKDLKEAIGLNQKFLFMNDLFEGENTIFHEAIDKINTFENLEQAMTYVNSSLFNEYNWDKEHKSVMHFIDLIERRFMA